MGTPVLFFNPLSCHPLFFSYLTFSFKCLEVIYSIFILLVACLKIYQIQSLGVPVVGMNLTSIHKDAGLIPGPA